MSSDRSTRECQPGPTHDWQAHFTPDIVDEPSDDVGIVARDPPVTVAVMADFPDNYDGATPDSYTVDPTDEYMTFAVSETAFIASSDNINQTAAALYADNGSLDAELLGLEDSTSGAVSASVLTDADYGPVHTIPADMTGSSLLPDDDVLAHPSLYIAPSLNQGYPALDITPNDPRILHITTTDDLPPSVPPVNLSAIPPRVSSASSSHSSSTNSSHAASPVPTPITMHQQSSPASSSTPHSSSYESTAAMAPARQGSPGGIMPAAAPTPLSPVATVSPVGLSSSRSPALTASGPVSPLNGGEYHPPMVTSSPDILYSPRVLISTVAAASSMSSPAPRPLLLESSSSGVPSYTGSRHGAKLTAMSPTHSPSHDQVAYHGRTPVVHVVPTNRDETDSDRIPTLLHQHSGLSASGLSSLIQADQSMEVAPVLLPAGIPPPSIEGSMTSMQSPQSATRSVAGVLTPPYPLGARASSYGTLEEVGSTKLSPPAAADLPGHLLISQRQVQASRLLEDDLLASGQLSNHFVQTQSPGLLAQQMVSIGSSSPSYNMVAMGQLGQGSPSSQGSGLMSAGLGRGHSSSSHARITEAEMNQRIGLPSTQPPRLVNYEDSDGQSSPHQQYPDSSYSSRPPFLAPSPLARALHGDATPKIAPQIFDISSPPIPTGGAHSTYMTSPPSALHRAPSRKSAHVSDSSSSSMSDSPKCPDQASRDNLIVLDSYAPPLDSIGHDTPDSYAPHMETSIRSPEYNSVPSPDSQAHQPSPIAGYGEKENKSTPLNIASHSRDSPPLFERSSIASSTSPMYRTNQQIAIQAETAARDRRVSFPQVLGHTESGQSVHTAGPFAGTTLGKRRRSSVNSNLRGAFPERHSSYAKSNQEGSDDEYDDYHFSPQVDQTGVRSGQSQRRVAYDNCEDEIQSPRLEILSPTSDGNFRQSQRASIASSHHLVVPSPQSNRKSSGDRSSAESLINCYPTSYLERKTDESRAGSRRGSKGPGYEEDHRSHASSRHQSRRGSPESYGPSHPRTEKGAGFRDQSASESYEGTKKSVMYPPVATNSYQGCGVGMSHYAAASPSPDPHHYIPDPSVGSSPRTGLPSAKSASRRGSRFGGSRYGENTEPSSHFGPESSRYEHSSKPAPVREEYGYGGAPSSSRYNEPSAYESRESPRYGAGDGGVRAGGGSRYDGFNGGSRAGGSRYGDEGASRAESRHEGGGSRYGGSRAGSRAESKHGAPASRGSSAYSAGSSHGGQQQTQGSRYRGGSVKAHTGNMGTNIHQHNDMGSRNGSRYNSSNHSGSPSYIQGMHDGQKYRPPIESHYGGGGSGSAVVDDYNKFSVGRNDKRGASSRASSKYEQSENERRDSAYQSMNARAPILRPSRPSGGSKVPSSTMESKRPSLASSKLSHRPTPIVRKSASSSSSSLVESVPKLTESLAPAAAEGDSERDDKLVKSGDSASGTESATDTYSASENERKRRNASKQKASKAKHIPKAVWIPPMMASTHLPIQAFCSVGPLDPAMCAIIPGGINMITMDRGHQVAGRRMRVHPAHQKVRVPQDVWQSADWHFPGLRESVKGGLSRKQDLFPSDDIGTSPPTTVYLEPQEYFYTPFI